MRFRAVRIDVETEGPNAEFELRFDKGLVIISGTNSIGKSLLFQSLIYGLGLEGMYGSGRQHGLLTRALTEEIKFGSQTYRVVNSSVTVEIENDRGGLLTARRAVAGTTDHHLVATWMLGGITGSMPDSERRDYFVRRPSATVGEFGFHKLLTDFLGWSLPLVPTYNSANEVPLYPEILFPFLAIEQKTGWSGVIPRIPMYLQVRDPLQRGVEFYLGLNLIERARKMQRLLDHETNLRRQWDVLSAGLQSSAGLRGARLIGPPKWEALRRNQAGATVPTTVQVTAEVLQGSSWVPIETALEAPHAGIELTTPHDLEQRPNTEELNDRLAVAMQRMRELSGSLASVEDTLDMIHTQLGSLRTRLAAIEEERRRYEQLNVLVGLGSPVAVATFGHRDCPTCQQSLEGLEHQPDLATLDYGQSLVVLSEQAKTIKSLQEDAERSANDQVLIRTQLEREADELRREVKAIKADLITPDTMPSIAQLQERIQEENRRADLQNLRVDLIDASDKMETVAEDLRQTLAARRALGTTDLTDEERRRLEAWTEQFRQMLRSVGVTSFPVDEIELPVSGKPSVVGYDDVGFQASASDVIRLRWSYALSLMHVSLAVGGPHPGLLMMDEPRQQEVESFSEFLTLAAGEAGQIILTTSEPVNVIREALGGAEVQIVDLRGLLLSEV